MAGISDHKTFSDAWYQVAPEGSSKQDSETEYFKIGDSAKAIEAIEKKEQNGSSLSGILRSLSSIINYDDPVILEEQKKVLRYLLNKKHLCPTIEKIQGGRYESDTIGYYIPNGQFEKFADSIQLNPKVKAWHVANRADVAGKMSSMFKSYPSGESESSSTPYTSPTGDYKGGKGRKTRRTKRSKRTKRNKQSKKRRSTRRR